MEPLRLRPDLWRTELVPAGLFPAYAASMADAGYRLVRYPGGFNAEHYDWSTNTETPWGKWDGGEAGVSPVTLLATVPAASFITPSAAALAKEGGAAAIPSLATLSSNLVSTYASQVKLWEIGNEPWRSGGGLNDRATEEHDLASYAALVKTVAPTLKAQDPSILVYATWDWFPANQDDWSTLVSLVGPTAWASVDGIAIHPYCGTDPTEPLCSQIPSQIKLMSAAMGKTNFFVSEWSVTVSDTADAAIDQSFGIKNASELALAYHVRRCAVHAPYARVHGDRPPYSRHPRACFQARGRVGGCHRADAAVHGPVARDRDDLASRYGAARCVANGAEHRALFSQPGSGLGRSTEKPTSRRRLRRSERRSCRPFRRKSRNCRSRVELGDRVRGPSMTLSSW
jgi:hypothetical protein